MIRPSISASKKERQLFTRQQILEYVSCNLEQNQVKDHLVYGMSKMHEDMKRLSCIQSGAGVICTKLNALITYGHCSKAPKIQAKGGRLKFQLKCSAECIFQISLPILISLFLQSPMGGHPDLPLSSSSSRSKGKCGPRTRSLYHGSK